jgi:transposase
MTIPGVGHLTALAFTAAVDDPERFRRSRDLGAYLGLVPRRYQSGEVDYTGSISKCGDRTIHSGQNRKSRPCGGMSALPPMSRHRGREEMTLRLV